MFPKVAFIFVGILLLVGLSGCIDSDIPSFDNEATFHCDPSEPADLHLVSGSEARYHVYDIGETKTLERITGYVEQTYRNIAGSGSILFFMSNYTTPQYDDIVWIRVWGPYDSRLYFDKDVVGYSNAASYGYKITGRYFIIGALSATQHQMVHSEGTLYFATD